MYGEAKGTFAGISVAGDLGDQQAATFGQAAYDVGDAKNTYGTGCFIILNTGTDLVPSKSGLLTTVGWKLGDAPAVYALEGSIAITGALVQWLRDNLGLIGSPRTSRRSPPRSMTTAAAYFVPAFSGLFAPYWRGGRPRRHRRHDPLRDKGHIARAALEATAWQTREVLDAMDGRLRRQARRSSRWTAAWSTTTSDAVPGGHPGVPVIRPTVAETTALGAAYAAGLAVGFWKNVDDLRSNWGKDAEWKPSMDSATVAKEYAQWKKAVTKTFDWVD